MVAGLPELLLLTDPSSSAGEEGHSRDRDSQGVAVRCVALKRQLGQGKGSGKRRKGGDPIPRGEQELADASVSCVPGLV